ncbi:hypothetical protein THAOC_02997, partial [Thalassiosira oceanica]
MMSGSSSGDLWNLRWYFEGRLTIHPADHPSRAQRPGRPGPGGVAVRRVAEDVGAPVQGPARGPNREVAPVLQAVTGPLSFTLSKADIESVERIQAEITRLQGVAALDQSAILAKQLEIDALLSAAGAITTTSFELALIKNLRYHQLTYGPSHRATRALESSFAAYKGSKAAVNERLEATPRRLQQALFFVHLELARIWKS